jgi:ABC-2 type transport system ATP-binding protein
MLQRVGLAQALINDPEVVFLDEPMSGLDPIGRREVRDLIASLRSSGKTVFMCSHILSDIEVLCDRAAILRAGRLANIGSVQELHQRAGSNNEMEVVAVGADAAGLRALLAGENRFRISPTASGLKIRVSVEADVDAVILALRKTGGQLVSVQPVKQSLEELFLDNE